MGTVDDKLLRYKVLNRCLRDIFREYTIEDLVDEVNKALRKAYDKTACISKRTIQDDLAQLQLPPHSIILRENLKSGRKKLYRYKDPDFTLPMFRMNDKERSKIKEAIRVLEHFEGEPLYDWARAFLMQVAGGLLNDEIQSKVSFQSNPDLEGLQHFSRLHQAIVTKKVLKLKYKPYGKDSISYTIYPYHLKQFNDRWYLIAQAEGYEGYARYALDRIDSFSETTLNYKEPDTDFSDYFDDYIGITDPGTPSEGITIKVAKKRFDYIRTKPIHLTQRIIEETEDSVTIYINVKVNNELETILLSFGDDVEVLSPASLRSRIRDKILSMQKKYLNDEEFLHS